MLLKDAMDGKQVDRAPVVAKIWLDLAAELMDRDIGQLLGDPCQAAATVVEASKRAWSDGARIFLFSKREIRKEEDGWYHWEKGARLGKVDQKGGYTTILDKNLEFELQEPRVLIHYQAYKRERPFLEEQKEVERLQIPSLATYHKLYGSVVEHALKLTGNDICPIGDCNSGTLAFCIAMHGMMETMTDMYDNPLLLHEIMDRGITLSITQAKFMIDKGIRVLRYNDSPANMRLISPEAWRTFIFPYIKRFCKEVHDYCPDVRIYCHICGNIYPVIPDLIGTGLDCIGPLDPLGGKSVGEIRKAAGDTYMLMGGVNTLSFLTKTKEEIRNEAKSCIRQGFTKGHYAVGSGCAIPPQASLEKIRAMAEASRIISGEKEEDVYENNTDCQA